MISQLIVGNVDRSDHLSAHLDIDVVVPVVLEIDLELALFGRIGPYDPLHTPIVSEAMVFAIRQLGVGEIFLKPLVYEPLQGAPQTSDLFHVAHLPVLQLFLVCSGEILQVTEDSHPTVLKHGIGAVQSEITVDGVRIERELLMRK